MACRTSNHPPTQIGRRLELTRRALNLLLGTSMATWDAYEAGLQRIPPDQALKLSPYGIPLDWIYRGSATDLHPHIRAKIREARDQDCRFTRPKPSPR